MPGPRRYRRPEPGHDSSITTCRQCAGRIRWFPTAADKKMPVDVDPTPDGNVHIKAVIGRGVCAVVLNNANLERARKNGTELFKAHFATCSARNAPAARR